MKLFHSQASPFARKVRACAIELGLAERIELVPVVVAPTRPNADYARDVNPLRRVPALLTDDGVTLLDSQVICEYLDHLAGGGRLYPPPGPARWDALVRHALANQMTEIAVGLRYETALRAPERRWPEWIADQQDKLLTGLAHLESRLPAEGVDIGTVALGCLLGYLDFRFADLGWQAQRPVLARWWERTAQRPSMIQTQPA